MACDLGILVSGRGSNLEAILDSIQEGRLKDVRVSIVISSAAGARALEIARKFGVETEVFDVVSLKLRRPEYDRLLIESLRRHGITSSTGLVVLAGFDRILTAEFVKEFSGRLMNIHPALLPAFKGLHAQKQALDHGVKVSGCTVHFVVPEVDSGPIIVQKAVEVKEDDDEESLSERILREEHQLLPKAIQLFVSGKLRIDGRRVVVS
ncbi:MAG: phosphoribosylglycinamide formyltransferase [Nitrososphaerales archaeon]